MLGAAVSAAERLIDAVAPASLAAAQATSLREVGHRPWPRPERAWLQGQTWLDLLFARWALPAEALRAVVPAELPIDTFDGRAWLGVTPFEVAGLRGRGLPPPPILSRFAETNVRTYTTIGGRPGIHFFSLDAASTLAVQGARLWFRLPYHRADMTIERAGAEVRYATRRRSDRAALRVRYRPEGAVFQADPGTVEHFLTERYCLYTLDRHRRVLTADIHHRPWPLQPAAAEVEHNSLAPEGIGLSGSPLLHYAARQDVVVWSPRAL